MASFANVPGMNPSTIDFKLATVTVARGSTSEHQELITLADAGSSLGIARVLDVAPPSTEFGLVVRVASAGNSTVIQGTNPWVTTPNSTAWVKSAGLSVDSSNALNVKIDGSTALTIGSIAAGAGRVNIGSSAADNAVTASPNSTSFALNAGFHFDSSGALQTSASFSGSTTVNVSSLAGKVTVDANSTSFAINAGFHFDSSGALQTSASFTGSTTVNVSSLAGKVTVDANSTSFAINAGFHFDSSGALQTNASFSGSTTVQVSSLAGKVLVAPNSTTPEPAFSVRISDGSTWVVDYVNGSTFTSTSVAGGPNFLRAGAVGAASTDTWTLPWGSSAGAQVIANADSSGAIVFAGDGGNNAIRVNVVAGSAASTIVTVSAWGAGLISSGVAAGNSSALTVRNVWSSTSADQPVLATIGTNLQSTVAPSSNSSGLIVRVVVDNIITCGSSNAFATSTLFTLASSVAGVRSYVTAYSILSTNAGPSKVKFYDGSSGLWPMVFAAVSSAISGANLAVAPPGYLFRTKQGNPLTLHLGGGASSTPGFQVGVTIFRAP